MKAQILKLLRAENGVVSGQALSAELGISRVSVWKHIKKLREVGYGIRSFPNGYQLLRSPDTPFAWEFPGREASIFYFAEVDSTMDIAKELARKGCPNLTVVVADRQNKGRGRLNRKWLSDAGGLYFTLVLRPEIPIILSSRISFLTSLTLARVLREMFDIDARVKWPNDILVNERKICGMLSEMEAEADRVNFINIGIGVNVNNDPSRSEPQASSLKVLLGRKIARKDFLRLFLDEFEAQLHKADLDRVISEWKRYTVTLHRRVRIVANHDVSEGTAVDVDANGALILQMADGSRKKILYGDCFHRDRKL